MGCSPSKDAVQVIHTEDKSNERREQRAKNNNERPKPEIFVNSEPEQSKVVATAAAVGSIPNHNLRTLDVEESSVTNKAIEEPQQESQDVESNVKSEDKSRSESVIVVPIAEHEEEEKEGIHDEVGDEDLERGTEEPNRGIDPEWGTNETNRGIEDPEGGTEETNGGNKDPERETEETNRGIDDPEGGIEETNRDNLVDSREGGTEDHDEGDDEDEMSQKLVLEEVASQEKLDKTDNTSTSELGDILEVSAAPERVDNDNKQISDDKTGVLLVTDEDKLEMEENMDPDQTTQTQMDSTVVKDEENIITDRTELPNVPANPRPAKHAALYGNSKAKWPIRNMARVEFPVNSYYGGCASLLLCSNNYGGKGSETTAEIFLVRSGFDCNHYGVVSIMCGNSGHFGAQNSFQTNEEGLFHGNLMFGTNKIMLMSNDCQYGDLSNGVLVDSPPGDDGHYRMFADSNCTDGSNCQMVLCSGGDDSHAVYMIRTGYKDNYLEAKPMHGDNKWKFDVNDGGEVMAEGPAGSRFCIYSNRPDKLIEDSSLKKPRVFLTQATDGRQLTTILDNMAAGVLMVLCSSSHGMEDATAAAVYMITVSSKLEMSIKLLASQAGKGLSSSDLWEFESVSGRSISVKGPANPCRYAMLSNLPDVGMATTDQAICLGTGDPHTLQGEVLITDKLVKGIIGRPSKVCIKVNHKVIASFRPGQLKQIKDGFAFCREWKQGEITTGISLVRVFAVRNHVTSGKPVMLELQSSPTAVITQKKGVAYAINCGGPDYTSLDDITYTSEHRQFVNYRTDFNTGARYTTYGEAKIHTSIASLLMNTHDGSLYASLRTFSTEAIDEQKVHYNVAVPNGTYVLKMHFINRMPSGVQFLCNGTNIAKYIREASDAMKDFLPEHGGYTTYLANAPVTVTDGKLTIVSTKQAICGFSLLDMDKYVAKQQSSEEVTEETEEKQRLMDSIEPLVRSHRRKELQIVGWSQNLLKNSSGEEGNLSHWNTSGDWKTCEGGYGTEKAFQTSHMDCEKYQSVNLLDHFSAEYLDTAPDIQAFEWYREGTCGGGFYKYEATLQDAEGNTMKSYQSPKIGTIYKNNAWQQESVTFTNYGPGVRFVAISSYGKDDKYWGGHYGTLMSSAEVRVKRETQPAHDDRFSDIHVTPEEAEFIVNRDKLVVKMLSDNKDLMTELMEDKVLTVDLGDVTQTYVRKKRKPRKHRKREIRVFVSSTFKDFSEEREQLIKKTFREINQMCADRGVFFTYVDLRWGISEEQSKTGQTIAICLQEIDRCRPYFICMLGQRFGWSKPSEKTDESLMKSFDYAIENHPSLAWIDNYRDNTSVTQLEIMHGVLNDIEARKKRSFFYLRDPTDPSKMSEAEFKMKNAESEWHAERQSQLRTSVATAQEINSRQFASPEEVGLMIKEDLEWCVNEDFPLGTELTPLEREQEAHQAFGDVRCQVYIGREHYFEDINRIMDEGRDQPFVLLGESGSGKSALVANWVKRVREKEKEKDSFVFVHFIGSSAESASYLKLLRRLYEELKNFFDIDLSVPSSDTNLVLDLGRWLKIASARGKCVIVFDALNQLNDGSGEDGGEHDLLWIPRSLPRNVFLLLSTLPGRAMEAVKTSGWQSMKVEPLDESQKREIIIGYLEGVYSKTLSDEQKQLMIDAPQTKNPLYLRSLLDEVRVYGSFRTLTQKIQEYLLAGNPGDLFAKILERLEGDFEHGVEQRKGLVRETTTAIWCSHRGMAEGEITDLLDIPSAVWSPFYLSLVENLVNRNGVVNFFHDHLRQAVEKKYLSTPEEKKESFKHLADFFSSKNLDDRVVDELPFLLGKAGELDRLKETISDLEVFSRLVKTEDGQFELIKSWQLVGDYSQAEVAYLARLAEVKDEDKHTENYTQLLDRLGDFFVQLGLFTAARRVYEQLLEQLEDRYAVSHGTVVYTINTFSWNYLCKHPNVINALHQLGLVCEKQMELVAGVKYYQDAISRQNRIVTPAQKLQLCEGLLGLATVYILQENMREAKKLLVRSLELAADVLGHKHHYVAAIHNKLGKLSYSQNMVDKAVGYFLQDLKLTRSDVGMTHPRIAGILSDLALVYDDRNDPLAGQIYETALAMLLDTYGHSHVEVAVVRYNLGTFYFATNYFAKAKYQFKESYSVFLSFLGAEHPDTKAAKQAMDEVGPVTM